MDKKTAADCIHCGVCKSNCAFLSKYGIDIGDTDKLKELAYHCFLCGRCTEVCPLDIDGKEAVLQLRRERVLSDERDSIEKTYKGAIGEKRNYIYRNWKHAASGTAFFPGCNFPSLFPKTAAKVSTLFADNGIGTIYECCGKPIAELGFRDDEERIIEEIRNRLSQNNVTELVVACPNCRGFFGDRLGIKVTSVYTKLRELGIGSMVEGDIIFYLPCPDRNDKVWADEIRPLIKGEVSYIEGVQCCGLGGNAIMNEKEISAGFTEKLAAELSDNAASGSSARPFTYCASCTGRFSRNGLRSVGHILTEILGTYEKPDTMKSYINRVFTRFK